MEATDTLATMALPSNNVAKPANGTLPNNAHGALADAHTGANGGGFARPPPYAPGYGGGEQAEYGRNGEENRGYVEGSGGD
eukprot:1647299-Rhodomonas_salina.1